ncbi:MAG: malto-oligosyltrehalose synthase, partial [Hyphomicrobiaceae bacterium]
FGLVFEPGRGELHFTYGELRLPLHPVSCAGILARVDRDDFRQLSREFVVASPGNITNIKGRLALLAEEQAAAAAIRRVAQALAADRDALDRLHERQIWRLCHWQVGREALTYRRFFEITGLVGIRVEREDVFRDVHDRLLRLVADGYVTGLRIDHIDGLVDPAGYLDRLHYEIQQRTDTEVPVIVEKILGPHETIPTDWRVAGTTGYEFANAVSGLLVSPAGRQDLTDGYQAFLGESMKFDDVVDQCKRRIIVHNLAAELARLTDLACGLASSDRSYRDIGRDTMRAAIAEIAVALPVYRTYIDVQGPGDRDRTVIRNAVAKARVRRIVENETAFVFLERVFLLDLPTPEMQAAALDFTQRFQQTTGPIMAKALEDTAFYRYNRFIALNEVGGEPDVFGIDPDLFHDEMRERLDRQSQGLSSTATHDTKRGEDARARICALSEAPAKWTEHVARWNALNRHIKTGVGATSLPDPNAEWLFYQALLGAWPADLDTNDDSALASLAERMSGFMLKAAREAKQHTSWTQPDRTYERALDTFVRKALDHMTSPDFLSDFAGAAEPFVLAGALNSMAQTLIKLMAPGVPDIYQGTETWDLSLVDPDNRRSIDFSRLQALLGRQSEVSTVDLLAGWRSGLPKLRVIARGLAVRREWPWLFAHGDYRALRIEGDRADKVFAFARTHEEDAVIAVVPRLALDLLETAETLLVPVVNWQGIHLNLPEGFADRRWRSVLGDDHLIPAGSNGRLDLTQVLGCFPVALLVSAASQTNEGT